MSIRHDPLAAATDRRDTAGSAGSAWGRTLGPAAMAFVLMALCFVAFRPVLDNDFLTWDDDLNFVKNPRYRGLGWSQVGWALTTFHMGSYQPLGWLLLSAEWCGWGLDPRGYHAVSVVLHAATAVALYALTLTLLRFPGPASARASGLEFWAGVAVALYAVHPLRVEAVAWASSQPYLLSALFFVLAILAYVRAYNSGPGRRVRWRNAALLLHGISLSCKPMSVSLPGVLLILDVYPLGRLGGGPGRWFGRPVRGVWLEKTTFLGLSLIASFLAYLSKVTVIQETRTDAPGLPMRIAGACYAACVYLIKTIVPRDVSAYDFVPPPLSWTQPLLLGSLSLVVGLSLALVLFGRRCPALLAGWAAWLVILVPVSGLVSLGTQLVAARYTYLAAMAWVPPVAAGLARLASTRPRWAVALGLAGLGVISALVIPTRELSRSWHDSESLWTHALAHGGGRSMVVYNNLGTVYLDQGRFDRAIGTYRAALTLPFAPSELTPRAMILYNLGSCLERQGKVDEAVVHFADLTRLIPQVPDVHYHLGRLLVEQGKVAESLPHFQEALRLNPNYAEARAVLRAAASRGQVAPSGRGARD